MMKGLQLFVKDVDAVLVLKSIMNRVLLMNANYCCLHSDLTYCRKCVTRELALELELTKLKSLEMQIRKLINCHNIYRQQVGSTADFFFCARCLKHLGPSQSRLWQMSSREWAPCFRSGNVEFQLVDGLIVGAIEVSAKLSDLASSKGVSDAAVKHLDELKTSVRKAFGSTMQSSSDMVASPTRQFQTLVDCVKSANGEEELLSVTIGFHNYILGIMTNIYGMSMSKSKISIRRP